MVRSKWESALTQVSVALGSRVGAVKHGERRGRPVFTIDTDAGPVEIEAHDAEQAYRRLLRDDRVADRVIPTWALPGRLVRASDGTGGVIAERGMVVRLDNLGVEVLPFIGAGMEFIDAGEHADCFEVSHVKGWILAPEMFVYCSDGTWQHVPGEKAATMLGADAMEAASDAGQWAQPRPYPKPFRRGHQWERLMFNGPARQRCARCTVVRDWPAHPHRWVEAPRSSLGPRVDEFCAECGVYRPGSASG